VNSSASIGDRAAADASRRTFLAQVIGGCIAFLGTLLGIPAVGLTVGPALKREDTTWLSLGDPETFKEGVPTGVNLSVVQRDGWIETNQVKGVWVVRQPDGQFSVFNARCTHLGCAYSWRPEQNQFACPCHGGVYDTEGKVVAGPPPRPLDGLESRIEGGKLQVQYQDFVLGTPDRVPA
jgi:menaquinol-cytochrome c reductase iron-sulfur subunit